MALKSYRPTSPGRRTLVKVDRSGLWKGRPEKTLVTGVSSKGGRNNHGHVTSRNKSTRHKRLYRIVDFKRQKMGMPATVERLEYDPNRTAFIALIVYTDGTKSYILAPQKLEVGQEIIADAKADIKPGNAMQMKNMPVGTVIHNVEMKPGKGAQIVRSAGTFAQIAGRDGSDVQIKLSSGELRKVSADCMATVGAVSNPDHQNISIGKAGRNRWLGRKPHVRGVAMNPIDHPHGGGEGRTSGGRHPVTPWGVPTKGKKTRHNKRTDKFIVRRRNSSK
jgi:large subunit ribosomal protein L2